jgi:hypothetical protein
LILVNAAARAFNAVIRRLAEVGISIAGTRALRVRGRKSGTLAPHSNADQLRAAAPVIPVFALAR